MPGCRAITGSRRRSARRSFVTPASIRGRDTTTHLHDARCRSRGGESRDDVSRARRGRADAALVASALEERPGLPTATRPARTLAHRHCASPHRGDVLLLVHRARWLQPLHRALGAAPPDDGARGRAHRAAREGEVSGHARARDPDNGPQFIAKDFKEFIALAELTHVRTAPYYPQSNGKQERWYQSFKAEASRPGVPVTYEDGLPVAGAYVDYYNTVRLHSAIGYVTPLTRLEGRQQVVFDARDQKLAAARLRRADLGRTALDPLHA